MVPIRIGVLTEMGGPYAEDSGRGSVAAVRFAVEDFRRQQPGFAIELVSADAQTKPDVAAAVAGAWYGRDGVDMIIDVPVSNCALAVAGVARSHDKVAIFNTSTSDLTGKACSPNHVHWAFDTYALSASTAHAMLDDGGDTWFLIQADYTFGAVLAAEAAAVVQAGGGRVLGTVRHPFPGTTDFSSYLLAAQTSGAKVIGLANAGADAANCIKQAAEFGLTRGGARLAALQCLLPSIHGIGTEAAQGALPYGVVLLGHGRGHPRVFRPFCPCHARHAALYDPRRLLRRRAALPESGRLARAKGRPRRRRCGRG